MIGHSIFQDGVGFNFFSPLSYWYIACGEEKALQYSCLDDIGQDTAEVISKVRIYNYSCIHCVTYKKNCSCYVPRMSLIWQSYYNKNVFDMLQRADITIQINVCVCVCMCVCVCVCVCVCAGLYTEISPRGGGPIWGMNKRGGARRPEAQWYHVRGGGGRECPPTPLKYGPGVCVCVCACMRA